MSKTDKIIVVYVAMVVTYLAALIWWAGQPRQVYVDHHPVAAVGAVPRSGRWPAVRDAYLKQHPACEACGSADELNVHHVEPFHLNPSKELDPTNLITLCRAHHLTIGHACGDKPGHDNWSCDNPNVRRDAAKLRRQTAGRGE